VIRIDASGLVFLVAVVATGLLASCGGGGSGAGGGGGDGAPSKQEFARNADRICADVEQRVADLNKNEPRTLSDLTQFIERLKVAVNEKVNRLQALERPTGGSGETVQRFTDALDRESKQQVLPTLNRLQKAVANRDRKALRKASRELAAIRNQASDRLASALGATKCASG
jgi:hypothetical protein